MRASKPILLFALFLLISLLTRAPFFGIDFLDIDESCHLLGARELMSGKVPYRDFIDNKPPLLYVYYAIAQILFGRSMFAVHLLTAVLTVPLTALAAARFYEYSRTGMVSAILFLVYGAAFLAHDMHATNAEILMVLPAAWAVVLVRDEEKALQVWRAAAAGLLLGIGVLFKYQIALWMAAPAAAIALADRRRTQPWRLAGMEALLGISFLLPLLAAYAVFDAMGAGKELIDWNLRRNLFYAANPISLKEAVGRATAGLLPFLLATSPLWVFSFRRSAHQSSRYRTILLNGLLLSSIPAAFLGFRFFPHYFIQFYFPLALAAAPRAAELLKAPMMRNGKLFAGYTTALLLAFTTANLALYYGPVSVYRETDPVFRKVGEVLKKDPCSSGAHMFVWGYAPMFHYYADLPAASRFIVLAQSGLTDYISGNLGSLDRSKPLDPDADEQWDQLMSDLDRSRCTYILDTAPAGIYRWNHYPIRNYPRLARLLQTSYEQVGDVDGVVIYRRSGCEP